MGEGQRDRRQHPRFTVVVGKATGRVTSVHDASLVDISFGGVLIEHSQVVRPGTTSSLDLDLEGRRLRLRCRVIRSVVNRIELQPDGEQALIYHTGLEFLDLSEETRQVISDYIQSITEDGSGLGELPSGENSADTPHLSY